MVLLAPVVGAGEAQLLPPQKQTPPTHVALRCGERAILQAPLQSIGACVRVCGVSVEGAHSLTFIPAVLLQHRP